MVSVHSSRTVGKTLGQLSGARGRCGDSWDDGMHAESASFPLEVPRVFPSKSLLGSGLISARESSCPFPSHLSHFGSTPLERRKHPRLLFSQNALYNPCVTNSRISEDLGKQLCPSLAFLHENTGSNRFTDSFTSPILSGASLSFLSS